MRGTTPGHALRAGLGAGDPALGRFLQADTIVPDPANPQSLNRYAYVLNNPLRYTDPSGHIEQNEDEEADNLLAQLLANGVNIKKDWGWRRHGKAKYWYPGSWLLQQLRNLNSTVYYARYLNHEFTRGDVTALDALVKLVDWRLRLGADARFVDDISICLLGDDGWGAVFRPPLHQNPDAPSLFWSRDKGAFSQADSGFREYYQDGSNQARHFWMYVHAAYVTGSRSLTDKGNEFHESNGRIARLFNNGGGTGLDLVLGYRGRELGISLREGTVDFNEAGDWVRRNLGPVPNPGGSR